MSTLTGRVRGANRKELEAAAEDRATAYFDTKCVNITLSNEAEAGDYVESYASPPQPVYEADYTATIKHRSNNPSYGFPICTRCGKQIQ